MSPSDAPAVLAVYAEGIASGDATFETEPPSWTAFDASRLPGHRFVARLRIDNQTAGAMDGSVVGWVAVTPTSTRPAYVGVVEHSVYVAPRAQGRGIGGTLLRRLIDSTEAAGIWTIQSGVFPENTASLALHARHGFRTVGVRERVGRHHGRWRDVVLLERRSTVAGR
jgi:phosphinothricin acetyltransferase